MRTCEGPPYDVFHKLVMNKPFDEPLDTRRAVRLRRVPVLSRAIYSLPLILAVGCASTAPAPSAPAMVLDVEERGDLGHLNLDRAGLAIDGYDPVSYFPEGGSQPAKGRRDLALRHRGVTYQFVSEANLELFKRTPAKFEPHYGGWCAYAMVYGDKVQVDPESYLIQDGRLLLFYDGFFNDTRKSWSKKPNEFGPQADLAWRKVVESGE